MRARVVKIGNSRRIRIPKGLVQEARLGEKVEIEAEKTRLTVWPVARPGIGWGAASQGGGGTNDFVQLAPASSPEAIA